MAVHERGEVGGVGGEGRSLGVCVTAGRHTLYCVAAG